jgi:hypothetical protein
MSPKRPQDPLYAGVVAIFALVSGAPRAVHADGELTSPVPMQSSKTTLLALLDALRGVAEAADQPLQFGSDIVEPVGPSDAGVVIRRAEPALGGLGTLLEQLRRPGGRRDPAPAWEPDLIDPGPIDTYDSIEPIGTDIDGAIFGGPYDEVSDDHRSATPTDPVDPVEAVEAAEHYKL